MSFLYETTVYNKGRMDQGVSYVKDGLALAVSAPKNDLPGTNPEQLIGMAWATCLNATIRSIIDKRGIENPSYVKVVVRLHPDTPKGLYFELHAYAAIKDMPLEEVEKYLEFAHKHCPVSKLIGHSEHVGIHVETYQIAE